MSGCQNEACILLQILGPVIAKLLSPSQVFVYLESECSLWITW